MSKTKNKVVVLVVALFAVIAVSFGFMFQKDKKDEVDVPSTVLTVEEAGTISIGDQYKEVIIKVPGVQIENGSADKIVVADSVGDGDVTLLNIKSKELVLQGGGPNSITIEGTSDIKSIRLERVDGSIRLVVTDSSNVEVVTVYEGSHDVILEGNFDELNIDASNIDININNSTIKSLAVSGQGTIVYVDKDSALNNATLLENAIKSRIVLEGSIENLTVESKDSVLNLDGNVGSIAIKNSALNTTINLTENADIKVLNTFIPTTVSGQGKVEEVVTNNGENVKGTLKAEKITLTKDPEDPDKPVASNTPKDPVKPADPKPANPKPTDPKPVDPKPVDPKPETPVVADTKAYDSAVAGMPQTNEGGKYTEVSWTAYETAKKELNLKMTSNDTQAALDAEVAKIEAATNKLVTASISTFSVYHIDTVTSGVYNLILPKGSVEKKFAGITSGQTLKVAIGGSTQTAKYEAALYFEDELVGPGWIVFNIQGLTKNQIKAGIVNLN